MPITLSSLKEAVRKVQVYVDDDELNVWYKLGELTPERTDRIRYLVDLMSDDDVEDSERPTQAEAWADMLDIIERWDITDDEGNELPVTEEVIATVPTPVLGVILEVIMEDARPSQKRPRRSRGGSFSRK